MNGYNIIHISKEDNTDKELEKVLTDTGFGYIKTNNCSQALEWIEDLDADTRINMILVSKNDNAEGLTNFFKHIKLYREILIVALADTSDAENLKKLMSLGFDDYISREYDPQVIAEEIEEMIRENEENKNIGENIKVAIIDDDDLQLRLSQTMLMGRGFTTVDTFISSEEFLATPKHYDLFLVDIVLEKMSGLKLIKELRKMYPQSVIIAVSGVDDTRIMSSALQKGADDFITKPVERDVLLAKIYNKFR